MINDCDSSQINRYLFVGDTTLVLSQSKQVFLIYTGWSSSRSYFGGIRVLKLHILRMINFILSLFQLLMALVRLLRS